MSKPFREALKKALLSQTLRTLQPPSSPSLQQLRQGVLGVGGAPHGHAQGMWGDLFGAMTPQTQRANLEDSLIKALLR